MSKSKALAQVEAVLSKAKKRDKKNSSRKLGRNYRWDYQTHSITKYRGRGNRDRNKARKVAKHLRRLALAARRRERHVSNGVH